jgi:hypothetical protein
MEGRSPAVRDSPSFTATLTRKTFRRSAAQPRWDGIFVEQRERIPKLRQEQGSVLVTKANVRNKH